MTALYLADAGEVADLAAFLARLIRWDKAAVVRLRAGDGVLAVFGRPPFGSAGVLAIRTARLGAGPEGLDVTVPAGQLLEGIDEQRDTVAVPPGVTGQAWAGVLPPRGGWRRVAELPAEDVRAAAAATVAEFRARTEALPPQHRTRGELDALADEIWSRPLGAGGLPLRAVHAAHALGFLRPARTRSPTPRDSAAAPEPLTLLAAGPWLRLRMPYGSVAVRTSFPAGLPVTPV